MGEARTVLLNQTRSLFERFLVAKSPPRYPRGDSAGCLRQCRTAVSWDLCYDQRWTEPWCSKDIYRDDGKPWPACALLVVAWDLTLTHD